MATTFTYDDVKKRLAQGKHTLSDADSKLAERNPDAAMSILNYKDDYMNATTDEARALANMNAENVRRKYGGYTGGVDGSNYYLADPSPSSFSSGKAPTFSSGYTSEARSNYDALKNHQPFEYTKEAPTFDDKYASQRDELINALANPEKFSYDHSSDESYKAYAKQYAREGQRATADTLAAASAQSGGIASSYALTAAGQQGNYYAAQLSDKIPELYQNAYNRYLNEYNMKREALNSIQSETNAAHDRYLGDYNVYNTDRNFEYQKYQNELARKQDLLSYAKSLEDSDYSRYRDQRADYESDRSFDYNQLLDTISKNQQDDATAYERAKDQASFRDYSGLEGYGFNMDAQRAQDRFSDEYNNLQLGEGYAGLGDYGNVDRLGIDSTNLRRDRANELLQTTLQNELLRKQSQNYDKSWADDEYSRKLELAKIAANQGDYSMLDSLGIDTTEARKALEASKTAASGTDAEAESTTSDAAKLYKAMADYKAGKATEEQYDILIAAGLLNADGSGAPREEADTSNVSTKSPAGQALKGVDTIKKRDDAILDLFKDNYVPVTQPGVSYAEAHNTVLSRNDWNIIKARGTRIPGVTDYGSYEEYLADVNEYLNQYYGG